MRTRAIVRARVRAKHGGSLPTNTLHHNARTSGRRATVAGIAALITLAMVVAGAPPAHATPFASGLTEAQLQDLGQMARQEGSSLDEAIAAYAWHEPFAQLVATIRQRFPSDFTGAGIDDDSAGGWIAFRASAPAEARRAATAFPRPVVVREGRGYTEADIDQRLRDVHESVHARNDVVNVASGYDVRTGRVSVQVESSQSAGLVASAYLREAILAGIPATTLPIAPPEVTVVEVRLGGKEVIHGGGSLTSCTAGFTVYVGAVSGVSTAGHCPDDQNYEGRWLSFMADYEGYWGDFQWHIPYNYGESVSGYFYYDWGQLRAVNSVGTVVNRQMVCKFGKATGPGCSRVYAPGTWCIGVLCNLVMVDSHITMSTDSGGPWFYGNTAYGIHRGYSWSAGQYRSDFSQVRHLPTALGVNVIR